MTSSGRTHSNGSPSSEILNMGRTHFGVRPYGARSVLMMLSGCGYTSSSPLVCLVLVKTLQIDVLEFCLI
ncbi:hypothetical protein Hanom_Chr17g01555391 [Helianthus anomalus]